MTGASIYLLVAACFLDRLIGDPRTCLHPVVLIGNLISSLEKQLLMPNDAPRRKNVKGMLLVAVVLFVTYAVTTAILTIFSYLGPIAEFFGGAVVLSLAISPRSLAEAGNEIKDWLLQGNLAQARQKVSWIVGRDTANLDTSEVTRATVETVAENIVDGIISPLFFAVLGGIPLAFTYRAVNTLDSMLGYKNQKYIDFGMIAARLDDVCNYVPARITGGLLIIAAALLGYDARGAFRAIRHDAGKHPSPNSGYAEAGVAGALGVRLGGLNYYGGVASFREHMGEAVKPLSPIHIQQTVYLMYGATGLFLLAACLFIVMTHQGGALF